MRRAYWTAFVVCAIAATVPLLVTRTMPMADLPEHMAQVAMWKHFDDPCHRFHQTFELNFATPYLLGYAITRALALFVTVSTAFKIVVWLTILALPLSLHALLAGGNGDPWPALFGFLFAYGYAFYWGFLNFSLATPIAIFYLALLFDRTPRDLARALLVLIIFLAHGLVFAFCAAVTVAVALARRSPRPLVALIPGGLLIAAFVARLWSAESTTRHPWIWGVGAPARFTDLSSFLFSNVWEPWGFALLTAIAVTIAVARPRLARDPARWAFATVAALCYFAGPSVAFNNAAIYQRFAIFFAIAVLSLFQAPQRARAFSRAMIAAIVLVWMTVLADRFRRFDVETRSFDRVIATIPTPRRVLLFAGETYSDHVSGPVYLHFAALYQVRRGGVIGWSFANWYPQVVRYRKGAEPVMRSGRMPGPDIDWPGVLQYDYVMIRGLGARWLRRSPHLTLRMRSGDWWLFETPRARMPQRTCAPLNE